MHQPSGRAFRSGGRNSFHHRGRHAARPGQFNRGRGARARSTADISKFINKTVITEEVVAYVPTHTFADFAVNDALKKAIVKKGYATPTPIQDQAIPRVLQGVDVVGIANTGTGKTAAFLIPLLDKVMRNPREEVLIVVPTRELALQIQEELRGFTLGLPIFSVCCVGGASIVPQLRELRHKNNFIIGTPGRLKDLVNRKAINLKNFNTIVLDEADRMLDMGFVNDMRLVMAGMPASRQTLFFSATLSKEIEKLIGEFLREPVRISVKTQDTSKNIEQDIIRVAGGNKNALLVDLLAQPELKKVLIFGRTKFGVEKLSKLLQTKGFASESIHGNKNQNQRQKALKLFKDDQVKVLVATDVAARGLDIADVSHVINYDLPATDEDYIHRIGRTGRGSKRGKALTFIE